MSKSVNSDAPPRPTTVSLFPAAGQPREGGDDEGGLRAAERRRIAAEQPSGGGGDFGGVAFEAFEGQVGSSLSRRHREAVRYKPISIFGSLHSSRQLTNIEVSYTHSAHHR